MTQIYGQGILYIFTSVHFKFGTEYFNTLMNLALNLYK